MNLLLRKTENRSKPNRRDFMLQTSCASLGITSLVNTLTQLKLTGAAAAQSGGEDYKALICLFLNGGNDSNNLLIPAGTTSSARADYSLGRGVLSVPDASFDYTPAANNGYFNGTAITVDPVSTRLNPINATVGGTSQFDPANRAGYTGGTITVHPGAYPLKTLFELGELSFFANIGTLIGTQQITRSNFNTLPASTKPPQLFSHSDQQVQWQSSLPDKPFVNGWGGRVADIVRTMNNGDLGVSVSHQGVTDDRQIVQKRLGTRVAGFLVADLDPFDRPVDENQVAPDSVAHVLDLAAVGLLPVAVDTLAENGRCITRLVGLKVREEGF